MLARILLTLALFAILGPAIAQTSMTGTITGLPGTTGPYTFNGTLTPPAPPPPPPPAVCSSTAPSGPNLTTSAGTWSWSTLDNSQNYTIMLNGVDSNGDGLSMETQSGNLYANTRSAGWFKYNGNGTWVSVGNPGACS